MLPTQELIVRLAQRIEGSIAVRVERRYRSRSTPGLWSTAAMNLWQAHCDDPEVPLDPELFVACQPIGESFLDPWACLTGPEARRRYRNRVRRIIRALRIELGREIRRVEDRVRVGQPLGHVLSARDLRISPMGRYIAAQRAGLVDVAEVLRPKAAEQHQSCPLYRSATVAFLPRDLYPTGDLDIDRVALSTTQRMLSSSN